MIKVNYDPQTTLVLGYYPDSVNYVSIPEPFIEIEDEYQDLTGKQMCVVEDVYQEYVIPFGIQLQQAKANKIIQLKINRDEANILPMTSHQAKELIEEDGEFILGNNVYFVFVTRPTGNPATEPSSICFGIILNSLTNPLYYIRYSCLILEGETARKGYVALTAPVASSIMQHAEQRNSNNIHFCNSVENEINSCTSLEEVEAINITFN